ncbi:copper resistance protein CopD, partial [Escherichia coli]|nr:copper resistance protein CopD [Escherichia coli]
MLMASSMAGTPAWPIDREAVGALLTGSAIGAAWKLRMVMVALAALAALVAGGRGIWLSIVALCSAVALATLAWTGHGAMDEAVMGWVHLIVDILHLIASGAWVGALLGLLLLVSRPAARVDAAHLGLTHRALHGFGAIGTVVVGTILVTGLVN